MITNSFVYLLLLAVLSAGFAYAGFRFRLRLFRYLPPVVLIYLLSMAFCSLHIWDLDSTQAVYQLIKDPLTYTMVFVMLLPCSLKRILAIGGRLLSAFFSASLTIAASFLVVYLLMHRLFSPDMWRAFAALCGSWIGGGSNYFALQAAFNANSADSSYVLMVNSLCFPAWVMLTMAYVNHLALGSEEPEPRDTVPCPQASASQPDTGFPRPLPLALILIAGIATAAVSTCAGKLLHTYIPFLDASVWGISVATCIGVLGALTPLGEIRGNKQVGTVLLYPVIALLASRSPFALTADIFLGLIFGALILLLHGIMLLTLCRLFHLNRTECAVASLANIGGPSTAAILGGICTGSLMHSGVLMGLMGYVIGTPLSMLVGYGMQWINHL